MHLPVGTLLQGGRYEILRFISSGGFGCTYEARDRKFKSRVKSVAIKEFFVKDFCNRDALSNRVVVGTLSKKELVDKLREKFLDEADAIFELEHPNIVRVTDTFEENGTAYYVMEYINGSTLASIIEKEGALSEDKALGYLCQIADALRHIHSRNRMHLDVKPGNIMIDQSGKAVLIDFGVSKQYDEVCGENTSTLMGFTPGYAPLEQSNKGIREFSPTTDIYSLGATLYKLVTGQTPPDASDVNEDGLPALPQEISAPVRVAIEAAMQPRRKDRPQSVAEFLKLLENGGKSKDETLLNSSSTPGGEVSRSDGGESELSTVNTENAKNYTASPDDEETQVGIDPPRPSATPPFEKVGELSNGVNDDEATLVNSSSTPGGEVSRSGGGESELPTEKIENAKNYTANSDDDETRVGINPPRPSSTTFSKIFTVNGISFKMVAIEGGTFQMGSNDGYSDEKPVHSVTLSDYYIGETEVTQELWQAVMGSNPSLFMGDLQRPVECVSWYDCQEFIRKLNEITGENFKLPTEAQWEYAARGGKKSKGYKFSGSDDIDVVAWYYCNSNNTTHPVKQKTVNELGLYDMSGNVWELCSDWYCKYYYCKSPRNNPQGFSSGSYRVLRGGSFTQNAQDCRVALRSKCDPDSRGIYGGLRLAL